MTGFNYVLKRDDAGRLESGKPQSVFIIVQGRRSNNDGGDELDSGERNKVRIVSYLEATTSYLTATLCILTMFSEWDILRGISWPTVKDPLSDLLLSTFPSRSQGDWTESCWRVVGQIGILSVYLYRLIAAYQLFSAAWFKKPTLSDKVTQCNAWTIATMYLMAIYSTVLIFGRIQAHSQFLLAFELVFRSVALYYVSEYVFQLQVNIRADNVIQQEQGNSPSSSSGSRGTKGCGGGEHNVVFSDLSSGNNKDTFHVPI